MKLIDSLNEINRLLIAIEELSHSGNGAVKRSVITLCQNQVIEGKFPNHLETIFFCASNGIISEIGDRLLLTAFGEKLLKLNPERKYELNDQQKDILVRELFLGGSMKAAVRGILTKFNPAYASRTFEWSSIDNSSMEGQLELLELLKQSGLITYSSSKALVDRRYVDLVKELRKKPGILTPEELYKRLKNAEICGAIAEKIAFDFEIKRLNQLNCLTEAECIQKISDLDSSAGYDIASFNGQTTNLVPNRFIEVKGSTDSAISFYWSKNEIAQAKAMGANYWIYFIPSIDLEKKNTSATPILIQDPSNTVFASSEYDVECVEFFIKGIVKRDSP